MAKAGDKKIMVVVIILFAVAFGVIAALCYYKWIANKEKEKQIADLQGQITAQEVIKDEIPNLRQEKTRRVEAINQLTKILPTETMTSHQVFLRLLSGFAETAGIKVKTLQPPVEMPNPELNIKRYKYSIMVEGTFPQFVRFLSQIERHTRFLKLDSFEVANTKLGAGIWPDSPLKRMKLQITTYTYKP